MKEYKVKLLVLMVLSMVCVLLICAVYLYVTSDIIEIPKSKWECTDIRNGYVFTGKSTIVVDECYRYERK